MFTREPEEKRPSERFQTALEEVYRLKNLMPIAQNFPYGRKLAAADGKRFFHIQYFCAPAGIAFIFFAAV